MKLVLTERESAALEAYLASAATRASSVLARVEVVRAVSRNSPSAVAEAEAALAELQLLPLTDEIFRTAAALQPATLRSLDAIHLASAMLLQPELDAIVTYDSRMLEGARALGLPVTSPA